MTYWEKLFRRAHFKDEGGGAGADAGGGAAGGGAAGGGAAGAAGAGAGAAGGDPWYQPVVATVDKDTLAWLDGKKFPDMATALRSGAQADKLARDRNVIAAPDPAKLNEWDGWERLGWNKDFGAYAKAIEPPKLPDGTPVNDKLLDVARKAGHELRAPAGMVKGLYDKLTEAITGEVAAFKAQGEKASAELEATLRKDWGLDYNAKRALATRTAKAMGLGVDDLSKLEAFIGSAPGLMRTFADFGGKLGEATLVGGNAGNSVAMTPASAAAELRRLEADPAWMAIFRDERNPRQQDYVKQRMALIELIAKGQR